MSNSLRDIKNRFISELAPYYQKVELNVLFMHFCDHILSLNSSEVALNYNLIINDDQIAKLDKLIDQLKNFEPIQYIYGLTDFYGLKLNVNSNVLIPRPETEELVDIIIKENPNSSLKVLDIGTGSGCIAVSLAKFLKNAKVAAIDVSDAALQVAKNNATNNKVTIQFYQNDILNTNNLPANYDIIVSNPPYVRNLEKAEMQPNVLNHEPHLALFVTDENPFIFYDKIAQLAYKQLNTNGKLYFEINQYLGEKTKDILLNIGFSKVLLKNDFLGKDRFIVAVK